MHPSGEDIRLVTHFIYFWGPSFCNGPTACVGDEGAEAFNGHSRRSGKSKPPDSSTFDRKSILGKINLDTWDKKLDLHAAAPAGTSRPTMSPLASSPQV